MVIHKNISLRALNTFGIDTTTKFYCEVANVQDFRKVASQEIYKQHKHLILGSGSNILFTKKYTGLVIKNDIKGIKIIRKDESHIWIKAFSGEIWHDFVLHCIKNNWGGIENLSLIPGTVGAAPMQNIGAYGVEIKDVFHSLTAINKTTGDTATFNASGCKFGYRESIFKNELRNQYFITSVTLKLTTNNHVFKTSYGAIKDVLGGAQPTINNISDAVIKIRKSKLPDPQKIGNSGSFFKNPIIARADYDKIQVKFPTIPGYQLPEQKIKIPAGWLIEYCGWKGKKIGEIGVHDKQALVLVNYGNGKGEDIKKLAGEIQDSVDNEFGIQLQCEVNYVE